MRVNQWQKDLNNKSSVNERGKKRQHLSNLHSSNFRMRLYHELNVVEHRSNHRNCHSMSVKTEVKVRRSKLINMNRKQSLDPREGAKSLSLQYITRPIRKGNMVEKFLRRIFDLC